MTTTRSKAHALVKDVPRDRLSLSRRANCPLYQLPARWAAAYRAGEIGEAWLVESDYISDMRRYYGPTGETPWRTDSRSAQDILLGGGVHSMGILMWAMQTRAKQVFAYANHKAEPTLPINDCYLVSILFENGAVGKIIAASGNHGAAPTGGRLVIYRAKGRCGVASSIKTTWN